MKLNPVAEDNSALSHGLDTWALQGFDPCQRFFFFFEFFACFCSLFSFPSDFTITSEHKKVLVGVKELD